MPFEFTVALGRYLRDSVYKTFSGRMAIKPLMSYEETMVVEGLIKKLEPKKCLEWGCGYGTAYFSKIAGPSASWLGVEHDKSWAEQVRAMNRRGNVKIVHIAQNNAVWTDEHGDGSYEDFRDYIEYPAASAPFDLILIDGRARKDCLRRARELISAKGVVVLHDAERGHYHGPFDMYKYRLPYYSLTEGGIRLWLGSNGMDIGHLMDSGKYIRMNNKMKLIKRLFRYREGS